ncbi:hypothetical protein HK100_002024 [Physocladia obscura]|uniref:N-acetyltransferase domain-containing protein n=1 Tax=Physocladia obscura TaxID=109957 RepID=A0AAD5SVY5_9FUNG|nr:hypothetical protein HK100_002024 [Physocladia obscura]
MSFYLDSNDYEIVQTSSLSNIQSAQLLDLLVNSFVNEPLWATVEPTANKRRDFVEETFRKRISGFGSHSVSLIRRSDNAVVAHIALTPPVVAAIGTSSTQNEQEKILQEIKDVFGESVQRRFVAAMKVLRPIPIFWGLQAVAVHESLRGLGVGTAFMKDFWTLVVKRQNIPGVFLYSQQVKNLIFYTRLGFVLHSDEQAVIEDLTYQKMAHMFAVARRLRSQVAEFNGVTEEMFAEVAKSRSVAAAVRGRQRIIAALLSLRGCFTVSRLIDARKAELRLEIKSNASDSEKASHETSFNTIFTKFALMELEKLGFYTWLESRGGGSVLLDTARAHSHSNEWFVDAVDFLLPRPERVGSNDESGKKRESSATIKLGEMKQTGTQSKTKPHPAIPPASATTSASKIRNAPSSSSESRLSSTLKVASTNIKIPGIAKKTNVSSNLVAELEAKLQETRRECALLRVEIANMQQLLAQSMISQETTTSKTLATSKRQGSNNNSNNSKDSGSGGETLDPRAAEFLRMQSMQMMRHVFEMRELLLTK